MGMPSGLARSSRPPPETNPAAAACIAAFFTNSLLDIAAIASSLYQFFATRWLQLPSASTFRADVLLRRIRVNLHARAIPTELLSRTSGNIPKKQSLRDQPRKFKIAARLQLATFTSVQPFAFVARRSWQRFWWLFVAIHLRFRNELRVLAIESAKNFATISHKKKPFILFFALSLEGAALFQFLGPRRLETSVIPCEFHRRHLAPRWK